jgi:hypothetical protein
MVKKNKKIEHIYNNTYRAGAYYLFNYNIDEANKLLSRRGIDMKLPDSVGLATTYSTDKNIVVCYWDTDRPISEVFSIVAHENLHVASLVLNVRGVPMIDSENEISEAVTYLQEYYNYNVFSYVLKHKLYSKK